MANARFHGRLLLWAMLWSTTFAAWAAPRYGQSRPERTSDQLFTNDTFVRHLQIEISPEDIDVLRRYSFRPRNEDERVDVPATVREGDLVWTNVAVHLKGAFGSFRPVDNKPSLTLNFDEWVADQTFHGLEKISLNNSVQDSSYLNEKICREIFHAAGVPTPRADYATVELNGRALGLYVLTEGWNKQFLKRHFGNSKGNFYDLRSSDIAKPHTASSGVRPDDHTALKRTTAAVQQTNHARRIELLREAVDFDRLVTLSALDSLLWNWDGYAMNRNNYRIYHDLDADHLVLMPHGMDQMFGKPNGPLCTGRGGLLVKALLETREGRELHLRRAAELRTNLLDADALDRRIDELAARLRPAVKKRGLGNYAAFEASVMNARSRIAKRLRDIDAQLAGASQLVLLERRHALPLTNWAPRQVFGNTDLERVTEGVPALHIQVNGETSFGAWTTTVWLEEGRYRLEGRVKVRNVSGTVRNETGGAGFRVWSDRKETRGATWSWFPRNRDRQMGGLIPVVTAAAEHRLNGTTDWMLVGHEFELRQPIADVQLQCVLQGDSGEAWFDLSSIRLRRVAMQVGKSTSRND